MPDATAPLSSARTVLVTGFPVDAARRLVRELVSDGDRVLMLARATFASEAADFAARLASSMGDVAGGTVEVMEGDILELDLGLSGARVRQLHAEVQEIHHLAAISYLGIRASRMRAVNIEGLRELLELALGMRSLQRLCLWSTAFVAGAREGLVREDELMVGQRFRNPYEQTKAEAEVLARAAMGKLPITVVRPSIVVGDSQSGEVSRFDGPYQMISAIVRAAVDASVSLPGRGDYPLNVVPVDHAVKAAMFLTRHPEAVGGTFHLVDQNPLTARQFFEAVADAAERPRPSTAWLPGSVTRALLSLPGLAARSNERSFLEWFDTDVRFDDRRARALLDPGGLHCPPATSYVETLVRYVRETA